MKFCSFFHVAFVEKAFLVNVAWVREDVPTTETLLDVGEDLSWLLLSNEFVTTVGEEETDLNLVFSLGLEFKASSGKPSRSFSEEHVSSTGGRVDFHLIRKICVFDGSEFFLSLDIDNSKLAHGDVPQEILHEELKLNSVGLSDLDLFLSVEVVKIDLFLSLMVKVGSALVSSHSQQSLD